jgi:pseudouridine-5'-phosphate glycosidase
MHPLIDMSDEVREALADARPVVALESTYIAHGMPYPHNLETAQAVEKAVRGSGAVPATIGLRDGRLLVGLDAEVLEEFAATPGIAKVSSRDLGAALATGVLGATTVASALVAADLAGIAVFSTAGIGGVHRDAGTTFDISADLFQFTRSRVAVVCASAKSVLDLGLTLEYLETQCVPVIGFRCADFPAFYLRSSGRPNPQRLDDLDDVAAAIQTHWALGAPGSVLVTHPIDETDALDPDEMARVIDAALADADAAGIVGPGITPYLMKAVSTATAGRSGVANRAVLESTASLAAQVAGAYARRVAVGGAA